MFKEYDVVSLVHDIPDYYLKTGDRGTVLMVYENPTAYEVEICNSEGATLALLTLKDDDIKYD